MGFFDFLKVSRIKDERNQLSKEKDLLQKKLESLGAMDYLDIKKKTEEFNEEYNNSLQNLEDEIQKRDSIARKNLENNLSESEKRLEDLHYQQKVLDEIIEEKASKNQYLTKNVLTQTRKLSKIKELYKSMDYAIKNFFEDELLNYKLSPNDLSELESVSPSVILKLHCMDVKDLRKAYRENDKQINKILEAYLSRYKTKANRAIYQLMVVALRAELQNILYNLKYDKLEKSIDDVKGVTVKYLKIASDGNQSIAGTLVKFIGEIEYLFINAVKIEYNYYVKKEQAKQEQLAIREQMRQEAEERKALEIERKRVEKEEEKYSSEITKINDMLQTASELEVQKLQSRLLELQSQLADVVVKKGEITKLQNGRAGNVYIISNLGSFGENVFKIGMTRRINPQERVNELGDASVPFRFDVHSFIFSDNAVDLEKSLHDRMNINRINKVNLRKEFFKTTIDELEQLVNEIEPTAEFKRTMLAEEFRQSLSTDSLYTSDYPIDDDDNE